MAQQCVVREAVGRGGEAEGVCRQSSKAIGTLHRGGSAVAEQEDDGVDHPFVGAVASSVRLINILLQGVLVGAESRVAPGPARIELKTLAVTSDEQQGLPMLARLARARVQSPADPRGLIEDLSVRGFDPVAIVRGLRQRTQATLHQRAESWQVGASALEGATRNEQRVASLLLLLVLPTCLRRMSVTKGVVTSDGRPALPTAGAVVQPPCRIAVGRRREV